MSEQVNRLLKDLGPLLDPDEIRVTENGWLIVLDDKRLIDIEFDPVMNRILLSCLVGHIDESHHELTYRQLLQYNTLWLVTGGLRFSLSDNPNEVMLMLELPVPALEVQLFYTAIQNFIEVGSCWSTIITRKIEAGSGGDVQADDLSCSLIKV